MFHRLPSVVMVALSCVFGSAASSHEYWIDPAQTQIAAGDSFAADIRVGEFMRGSSQLYSAKSLKQIGIVAGDKIARIEGRLGDRPAIQLADMAEGLNVIGIETNASFITYQKFEKFETFAKAHGNDEALDIHAAKGMPTEGIKETYFRFAKALVRVGEGAGTDRNLGFPYELTALNNPYTDDGPVRFQLTYGKEAVPNHQVDVFHRPFGSVENASLENLMSDAQGVVTIPKKQGQFLISAVRLEEPNDALREQTEALWVSLWASSTYWVD